jgi:hypothetical protein
MIIKNINTFHTELLIARANQPRYLNIKRNSFNIDNGLLNDELCVTFYLENAFESVIEPIVESDDIFDVINFKYYERTDVCALRILNTRSHSYFSPMNENVIINTEI